MKQERLFCIQQNSLVLKSTSKKLSLTQPRNFDVKSLKSEADEQKIDALVNTLAPSHNASGGGSASASGENAASKDLPNGDFAVTVSIAQKDIEIADGVYDESLLACLRTFLKKLETAGGWVVISPVYESDSARASSDAFGNAEALISAISHAARRVKDCTSVIGIEIPQNFSTEESDSLKAELSRKHSHYIYFSRNNSTDLVPLD